MQRIYDLQLIEKSGVRLAAQRLILPHEHDRNRNAGTNALARESRRKPTNGNVFHRGHDRFAPCADFPIQFQSNG